jgi:hypothetical protein
MKTQNGMAVRWAGSATLFIVKPVRPTMSETNLYSEGADFLVLGHLLIRGVHASKASREVFL